MIVLVLTSKYLYQNKSKQNFLIIKLIDFIKKSYYWSGTNCTAKNTYGGPCSTATHCITNQLMMCLGSICEI